MKIPRSKALGLSREERRRRINGAEMELSKVATRMAFRPSYARNNPGMSIKHNVFWFEGKRGSAHATLSGPWVFLRAPGLPLVPGTDALTQSEIRTKHWPSATSRILVVEDKGARLLGRWLELVKSRLY